MIPAPGQKAILATERAPIDGGLSLRGIEKSGSEFVSGDGKKADRRLQTRSGR
jgi:hypothetical protein